MFGQAPAPPVMSRPSHLPSRTLPGRAAGPYVRTDAGITMLKSGDADDDAGDGVNADKDYIFA